MDELQPWRIVSDKIVFSSPPYITVRSHMIELPSGKLVEPFFRVNIRPSAIVCAVTSDLHVIVARQYRHGIGRVSLTLPGGMLEQGEDPLQTVKRELLEETGFAAESWDLLGHFVTDTNYRCGDLHLFLAHGACKVAEPDDDDLEETEWLLMPFPKLLDELHGGNVISLSSATAIALARARLGT